MQLEGTMQRTARCRRSERRRKAKSGFVTPAPFAELTPGFFTSGALAACGFGGALCRLRALLRALGRTRFFSGFWARPLALGFRASDLRELIYLSRNSTKGGADGSGNVGEQFFCAGRLLFVSHF